MNLPVEFCHINTAECGYTFKETQMEVIVTASDLEMRRLNLAVKQLLVTSRRKVLIMSC